MSHIIKCPSCNCLIELKEELIQKTVPMPGTIETVIKRSHPRIYPTQTQSPVHSNIRATRKATKDEKALIKDLFRQNPDFDKHALSLKLGLSVQQIAALTAWEHPNLARKRVNPSTDCDRHP